MTKCTSFDTYVWCSNHSNSIFLSHTDESSKDETRVCGCNVSKEVHFVNLNRFIFYISAWKSKYEGFSQVGNRALFLHLQEDRTLSEFINIDVAGWPVRQTFLCGSIFCNLTLQNEQIWLVKCFSPVMYSHCLMLSC